MAAPKHCSRRAVLAAAVLWSLSGCEEKSAEKPRSSAQRRVVSLSPGTTEAVFAVGAGDALVGRSRFCDYPPEVTRLPSVGGFVDPSFEAILGLAPDLVVGVQGPGGRGLVDRLEARGIATYFPPTFSIAEIEAMIRGVGQRLGADAGATRVVKRLEAQRATVQRALAKRAPRRALLVFGMRPVVAAGRGSFPSEMLRLAGAKNAVNSTKRYPTLGIEQVIALDPEVIVDASAAAMNEGIGIDRDAPGWKDVPAVRAGQLIKIQDDRVLRPGPRVGEGLMVLARALHPEAGIGAP